MTGTPRGKPVALKQLKATATLDKDAAAELAVELECEATLMSKVVLFHPNLVRFIGICVDDAAFGACVGLVTELCPLGSLDRLLWGDSPDGREIRPGASLPGLPWQRRVQLAQELASGVRHLHAHARSQGSPPRWVSRFLPSFFLLLLSCLSYPPALP